MNNNNLLTIKSTLEFQFKTPELCNYSYNSFLPEFKVQKSKRATITLKKEENSLIFSIESKDITAFRATINEIISFGRIFEGVLNIVNKTQ
ncbi:MAG TPA: KEOPS complex subunit Pcc1 [Candidatus Nanopelagicaceae bacterium]|nr:KEOPS complex subunit Pcc1 [Candidatus Nanopelagicaceae bacterium]